MLDLDGEDGFVHLAKDRPIARQINILDQLLRDRAATLVEAKMQQVVDAGLPGAQQVEATVLVEGTVLDRDRSLLHGGRNLRELHDVAPFGALMDLGQQDGSRPVVDAGREGEAGRAEVGGGRQPGPHVKDTREHHQEEGEDNGRHHHPGLKAKPGRSSDRSPAVRAEAAVGLDRSTTRRAERSVRVRGCPIHVDG